MYLRHYGLKRFPFDITSDPEFLWAGANHKKALEVLREGVYENRGFVVLIGEVGTGKTTLINAFRRLDDIATIIVTIPDPDMEVLDFFNFLSHEFEIEGKFSSPEEFAQTFKSFLLRAYASYRKVLIIIDEAQRLNSVLLMEISKLAKIEMAGRRMLKIFFVGQLEFNKILMAEENKPILDEVVAAERLEALSEHEIGTYINHRLAVAGCDRDVFTSDTAASIYHHTRGLPRAVNVLCDNALLAGFLAKNGSIDAALIDRCARKIRLPFQQPPVPVDDIPISVDMLEPAQYIPVKKRQGWKTAAWVSLLAMALLAAGYLAASHLGIPRKMLAFFVEIVTKLYTK